MNETLERLMAALQKLAALSRQKIAAAHQATLAFAAGLIMSMGLSMPLKIGHWYTVECYGADGVLKWREVVPNLVVNVGLDEILDKFYKGSAYTAAHYVGLKGTGTIAAADTMASHAGWTEIAAYSEATRPALTMGTVSAQSVDNSASKASFSINGTATVAGAFVSTNNTKSGSTGILIGAADFGASRSVVNGDTLNVTVTATASSS